jgi:hypothetical protein
MTPGNSMTLRTVLISLSLLTGALGLKAQTQMSMGLKAGLSLSNQKVVFTLPGGDYQTETGSITGPTASFFLEFSRGERWGIRLDAGYTPMGSSTTTESVTVYHLENNRVVENKGELKRSTFHYLFLSPTLRYRLLHGRLSPYLLAGPRIDFLLGYNNGSGYLLDDQNKLIPGVSAGGGVEFTPGRLGLFLEGLYLAGALPVTGTDPIHIRNCGGLLTIGLRYIR